MTETERLYAEIGRLEAKVIVLQSELNEARRLMQARAQDHMREVERLARKVETLTRGERAGR